MPDFALRHWIHSLCLDFFVLRLNTVVAFLT